jgi:hypothetical protein
MKLEHTMMSSNNLFNSKLIYLQNHTSSSRKKKEGGSKVAGMQIPKGRAGMQIE